MVKSDGSVNNHHYPQRVIPVQRVAIHTPGVFQRCMDSLFQGFPHGVVYLDDILVTSETEEQHLQNPAAVLEKLEAAGLRLKKDKCSFMKPAVEYLGHIIDKEGQHPTADRIKGIGDA